MLGWLFGNPSGGKVIDKIASGADALVFTNEEKMDLFIKYQEATAPQNLARRLLALMMVGFYLFVVLLAVITWQYQREYSDFLFRIANELLLIPVTTIIGFYFLKRFSMGVNQ